MIKYSVLFFVLILIEYGTALRCYTHGVVYKSDSNTDVENILKVIENRIITKVECQGTNNRCVNGTLSWANDTLKVPVGFCAKSDFNYTFVKNIKDPDGVNDIYPARPTDFSPLCSTDLCNKVQVTHCSLYGVELDGKGNPQKFIQEENEEKYVMCPKNQCAQAYVSYNDIQANELINQWVGYCKEINGNSEITGEKYCDNLKNGENKVAQLVSSCMTSFCEGENCNVKTEISATCANYGVNWNLDGSVRKITDDIRITYRSCSGDCISGTIVFEKSIQSNEVGEKISAGFCAPKSFSMINFAALATDVAKGRHYTIEKFDRCNTDFCNEKNLNKCLNYGVDVDNKGEPVKFRAYDEKDIQVISCPNKGCSSGYITDGIKRKISFGHCGTSFSKTQYTNLDGSANSFKSCFSNNCNIKLSEKPDELYCYIYGIGDRYNKDGLPLDLKKTDKKITRCPRTKSRCASALVTTDYTPTPTPIGFCVPTDKDQTNDEIKESLKAALSTTSLDNLIFCEENHCNNDAYIQCNQYGVVYNLDGSIQDIIKEEPTSSDCLDGEDMCVSGKVIFGNKFLDKFGFCASSRSFNANAIISQLPSDQLYSLKTCYENNCK